MTRQDFIQYLSHPEKLNGHSINDLELLVKEYPYFQAGRMLYLKNLHNQNSIDYEKNLHITSAYVPRGKVLYELIKKRIPGQDTGTRQAVNENPKSEIRNQELVEEQIPTLHPQASDNILPKLESIIVLREVPITKKEDLSADKAGKKDEFDELQVLEKEMLREAHRTSFSIDLSEEKGTGNKENTKAAQKHNTSGHEHRTFTFNDWLKVINGQVPESAIQEKAVQKEKKNEIIENYILEQAARSKPKPKAEFYSAEAMAKKSILDNETFVSETLATIYLRQGNLPKALRAYEILLVKYPEKFHIFAPLLEKIKNLLEGQTGK